ncbi:MAG: glutathione S-transferase family protein [Enhydrobacter sp.]
MQVYRLVARPGWGSAIVEAQLDWYGLPFTIEPVGDLLRDADSRKGLDKINPLAQVPTLILPDGTVMTESAAITLLLADQPAKQSLVPGPDAPERAAFLRWLVFIVANIYPTFTYADVPARFVEVEAARAPFVATIDAYRQKLWRQLEDPAGAPWFLGGRFSALDIFIAVMTRWGPKRPWFEKETPKLAAIARAVDGLPQLADMWKRNTPS